MRIGDKGVKIVRPEDAGFLQKPGTDAEVDTGYDDDIEDYDENGVVRRRKNFRLWSSQSFTAVYLGAFMYEWIYVIFKRSICVFVQ